MSPFLYLPNIKWINMVILFVVLCKKGGFEVALLRTHYRMFP
jgi:hypothetical protein